MSEISERDHSAWGTSGENPPDLEARGDPSVPEDIVFPVDMLVSDVLEPADEHEIAAPIGNKVFGAGRSSG